MKFNKLLKIVLWILLFAVWLFIWFVIGIISCCQWHICL